MTVEGGGLRRDSVGGGVRMEEELWRCSWIRDHPSTREAGKDRQAGKDRRLWGLERKLSQSMVE